MWENTGNFINYTGFQSNNTKHLERKKQVAVTDGFILKTCSVTSKRLTK